ncbi:MAG: response regulator transcription factor [Bacteroidales bacterium]|nr:response regulator transcription factor [Bacteroidales bacterium]MBK9357996.1 response regulator transcription factor [Bacteroidales bacterium]
MIRTIIIDDEGLSRETLREMLRLYCKGVEVVAEAESIVSGIEAITRHNPDLLLLDIKMPDGTGFDLLRTIMPISFRIIFVTAFEEYAIKAFRYNALDYLTKPIDPTELQNAIEKATTAIENENINERLKRLLIDYMKPQPTENRRIILKTAETIHIVDIDKIVRCESARNYTVFHMDNKEEILISKSIKEFSDTLESHNFYRVHHSHLINLKYLVKFKRDELMCVLSDSTEIPVATRKRDDLLKVLRTL